MSRGTSESAAGNRPCDNPNLSGRSDVTQRNRFVPVRRLDAGKHREKSAANQEKLLRDPCDPHRSGACRGPVGARPEQKRATYRAPA